ncbi:22658_t:CDS:2, partial [Cetraspora pellucida]
MSDMDKEVENFRDDNWKWPCYEDYYNQQTGKRERTEKIKTQKSDSPFIIIYEYAEKDCTTYVELSCKALINKLKGILSENNDLKCRTPKIEAKILFHDLDKLHDATESELISTHETVTESDESTIYLKHLIRFLKEEYKQEICTREWMIAIRVVSFDMLWVFFPPKNQCNLSGQKLGGEVSITYEYRDYRDDPEGIRVFVISIKMIDCDGEGFKEGCIRRKIEYFVGEKKFSELIVAPFEYLECQNSLEKNFAERGKKFFDLAKGRHYQEYKGPLLRWKRVNNCVKVERIRADGRIMIDVESFALMNPDYEFMENATPPNECDTQLLKARNIYLDEKKLIKEHHIRAPAIVYGFSFALKEWGCFDVSKINNVHFDPNALNSLVIPMEQREILEGLVKKCTGSNKGVNHSSSKSLDPIVGKGNGCIFLCYGPPGTGKTLTAESVAEFLEHPLWMMSVHELGTEPDKVEQKLVQILYIAHKWNAVLLLDEADIYLERRNTTDLKRNVMVSIFLRHLEYYQGVLFLTTNRVTNFDPAICSRVNMFFHYPKFDQKKRKEVWTKFIEKLKIQLNVDDFINFELNGREIRNVLHAANLLAQEQGKKLTKDIVIKAIMNIHNFHEERKITAK